MPARFGPALLPYATSLSSRGTLPPKNFLIEVAFSVGASAVRCVARKYDAVSGLAPEK